MKYLRYYWLGGGILIGLIGFYVLFGKHHLFSYHSITPLKIAIVDGARIKKESKPFLYVVETERNKLEEIYNQMRTRYESIRKLLELSKSSKIPMKDRAKYKAQFEAEAAKLEQEVQAKKDNLRQKFAILTKTLEDSVIQTTSDLAKKYNLSIIFNTNVFDTITIFYATPNIDLTDEAIKLLNQRLKNIKLAD